MLGKLSGVGVRLKAKFPLNMIWHCLNHRLELSVDDTLKDMNAVNSFKKLMDKMYKHFSQSTKNLQELESVAAELCTQLLRIGRILGCRWVASSFQTIKSVWTAHRPSFVYFNTEADELESRDSVQRATMRGIAKRLQSTQFVLDLGLLYDVLEELSNLSLQLQRRDMTLDKCDKACQRTIRVIKSSGVISSMHEFVDNRGALTPEGLMPLKNLIETFIVSTAEVERSFYQMNLICTPTRTRLLYFSAISSCGTKLG
ncbi:E3 SUMO-protein ligase KIAA1586 [Frankliniella fusca]|uniref:E3 SUMO-protein ligase KIAA1586 n=1 Tax=Frankliniella fusca TaxID=407009 RepID=A0AAE1GVK4_9NEOP|nr:E3 SUMO-protein ligase KIAA1586 [Frankliniella fusca]